MAHVDGRANRALAGIELGPDCIEGGVFHDHDHDGSGEYWRQCRVFEPVRKMLGLDEEAEGAFGSEGYLPHGLPSKGRDDQHDGQIRSVEKKSLGAVPLWSSGASISDLATRHISHTIEMMLAAMSVICGGGGERHPKLGS